AGHDTTSDVESSPTRTSTLYRPRAAGVISIGSVIAVHDDVTAEVVWWYSPDRNAESATAEPIADENTSGSVHGTITSPSATDATARPRIVLLADEISTFSGAGASPLISGNSITEPPEGRVGLFRTVPRSRVTSEPNKYGSASSDTDSRHRCSSASFGPFTCTCVRSNGCACDTYTRAHTGSTSAFIFTNSHASGRNSARAARCSTRVAVTCAPATSRSNSIVRNTIRRPGSPG